MNTFKGFLLQPTSPASLGNVIEEGASVGSGKCRSVFQEKEITMLSKAPNQAHLTSDSGYVCKHLSVKTRIPYVHKLIIQEIQKMTTTSHHTVLRGQERIPQTFPLSDLRGTGN